MCTGRESNQGPLGPKSDALTPAPLRHIKVNLGSPFIQTFTKFYILLVELESSMLHAKFQDHMTPVSGEYLNVFTVAAILVM